MDKLEEVTQVATNKVQEFYESGNTAKIALFETLQREKAIARSEHPEAAAALSDALRRMGAGLNEPEHANARSKDRTVELKAVENSIADNLAASGKSPDAIAQTLGVLKQVGALMAGGGVSVNQGVNVTAPAPSPNMPAKDINLDL